MTEPTPPTPTEIHHIRTGITALTDQVETFNDRLQGVKNLLLVMAVVVAAVVGLAGWGWYLTDQINDVVACQIEQNDVSRNSSKQARAAADRKDDEQIQKLDKDIIKADKELAMLDVILNPAIPAREKTEALRDYQAAAMNAKASAQALLDQTVAGKQIRKNNPLPSGSCL